MLKFLALITAVLIVVPLTVGLIFGSGAIAWLLWNALAHDLFGAPEATFWHGVLGVLSLGFIGHYFRSRATVRE